MGMSSSSRFPNLTLAWPSSLCTCVAEPCTCAAATSANSRVLEAATQFFLAHRRPVYQYLLHAGCGAPEAEDITQETFLRLYRLLLAGRLTSQSHVLPLLVRIARGIAIDYLRRRQLERRLFEPLPPSMVADLPDRQQVRYEDARHEREREARLVDAIRRLSPTERECLHLRAQGLSLREISEILPSLSVKNASRIVVNAIRRLRESLDAPS
jgi:RNA polymerase sigma-70 factor (ECF subfamily)